MKLIMENWRAFKTHEGREAYDDYIKDKDKYADAEKEGAEERAAAGAEKVEKGDAFEYTSKKGKESAVQVVDPENEHGATVAQKIDPRSCEPQKNSQFASKPEAFKDATGDSIDKCSTDGEGGEKGIEKGDSFEYTSKKGTESAVQVVDPENKHGATVAQKIDPKSCDPVKNSQFASNPEKFAAAVGDPIDQCDADSGGDSKIAALIAKKLKSSGLDKYIMKITKRNDLLELEKVILNLALDSSSPIKAADLLKVVTQLKADVQAKVKGAKKAKGAKEA
jgi:hypothetical protein